MRRATRGRGREAERWDGLNIRHRQLWWVKAMSLSKGARGADPIVHTPGSTPH